jgi:thiol-disulfide isomerase/thioredoxin
MKKWWAVAFLMIGSFGFNTPEISAQSLYTQVPDAEEKKYLLGLVKMKDIREDTAFRWYAANVKYYRPHTATVQALKSQAGKFQLVLFTGTWCHDSQQIIPKYFTCLEAASLPETAITIVATDREKKTVANLHDVFKVSLVPTLIVMQEGKEVGRIVEYGSTGLPDQELATLLSQLK